MGDIHPRACKHHLLDDEVVFFIVKDLLDGTISSLHHRSQFFILPLIEILLELATLALQISVLLDQITLTTVTLSLGERGCVFFQFIGSRLESTCLVIEFSLTPAKLRLELGLRRLSRIGLPQDALAVDITYLEVLRPG